MTSKPSKSLSSNSACSGHGHILILLLFLFVKATVIVRVIMGRTKFATEIDNKIGLDLTYNYITILWNFIKGKCALVSVSTDYQQFFTSLLILYEGCQNQAVLYGRFWHQATRKNISNHDRFWVCKSCDKTYRVADTSSIVKHVYVLLLIFTKAGRLHSINLNTQLLLA